MSQRDGGRVGVLRSFSVLERPSRESHGESGPMTGALIEIAAGQTAFLVDRMKTSGARNEH
jgi:hypothetical protein